MSEQMCSKCGQRQVMPYSGTGRPPTRCAQCSTRVKSTAWRLRHPGYHSDEKHAARGALGRAVRKGLIQRPQVCSMCWRDLPLEGHHHDYGKPLDVTWLCQSCHYFIEQALGNRVMGKMGSRVMEAMGAVR